MLRDMLIYYIEVTLALTFIMNVLPHFTHQNKKDMKTIYILLTSCLISCSVQTKNDKLEEELVKIKNQAFCDCYYEVTKNELVKSLLTD